MCGNRGAGVVHLLLQRSQLLAQRRLCVLLLQLPRGLRVTQCLLRPLHVLLPRCHVLFGALHVGLCVRELALGLTQPLGSLTLGRVQVLLTAQ